MTDLVQRLRDSATQARALDRSELLHEAAGEILRLRLTDLERESLAWAVAWIRNSTRTGYSADVLAQLLERTR